MSLFTAFHTVVLCGGTGTFGQAMARYLLDTVPHMKIRVLSRSELPQVRMQQRLPDPRITYMLGDVRDLDRLRLAFRNADLVLHAAALKHVPLGESNPEEVVAVNIGGTRNVIRASIECSVRRAVLLSTDKAVNPTTLYGATKLCAERLFLQANVYTPHGTDFVVTRYGNIMGSRGSVLPLFRALLTQNPQARLPVTHPAMTRFYMDIHEALHVVAWATLAPKGSLLVPHLQAFGLVDLCRTLLNLDTHQAVREAVDIVGIRPGEKLHEILLTDNERAGTMGYHVPSRCYVIAPHFQSWSPPDTTGPFWTIAETLQPYSSDVWPDRLVGAALDKRVQATLTALDRDSES